MRVASRQGRAREIEVRRAQRDHGGRSRASADSRAIRPNWPKGVERMAAAFSGQSGRKAGRLGLVVGDRTRWNRLASIGFRPVPMYVTFQSELQSRLHRSRSSLPPEPQWYSPVPHTTQKMHLASASPRGRRRRARSRARRCGRRPYVPSATDRARLTARTCPYYGVRRSDSPPAGRSSSVTPQRFTGSPPRPLPPLSNNAVRNSQHQRPAA
jgi:hypothetical protein